MDRLLPLLLGTAAVALWAVARRIAGGRWRAGAVAAAVALLLLTAHEVWWATHEDRYAAVTVAVHGGTGRFACERITRGFLASRGHVGHVDFDAAGRPTGPAFLAWDTCDGLRRWSADGDPGDLHAVIAAHTLVHEAAHLAGVRDEGTAECLALAHDRQVWVRLGATREAANVALQRYLAEVHPRLPSAYHGDCTAGRDAADVGHWLAWTTPPSS